MEQYTLQQFIEHKLELEPTKLGGVDKKPPILVVGAGLSIPNLPSAWNLKKEVV